MVAKKTFDGSAGDSSPLFVFELANNHMGDLDHGLQIIDECAAIAQEFDFAFGFKLQYRDLDTFIHPSFQTRKDIRIIQRFSETRLSRGDTTKLVSAIKERGLLAICTPFDETSVAHVAEDGFDILKIASCSLTDWPLLETIAGTSLPIIASTGGSYVEDIDRVVSFLKNRKKSLSLMACVAEYPTPNSSLRLNQIDFLKVRYPDLCVGYSTHEDPDETLPVAMAVAKGARIFEKHVGVVTKKYGLNAYSATPVQLRRWLKAAEKAFEIAGQATLKGSHPT